jgi:hypothetical protein
MKVMEEQEMPIKPSEKPNDKILLEKFGIDNRFISKIGMSSSRGVLNKKSHFKTYVPINKLEMLQTFSIYLLLMGVKSVGSWILGKMEEEVRRLKSDDDPVFNQAKEILRDLRRQQYVKTIENQDTTE